MRHHIQIQYESVVGEIDVAASRASCSCGWRTGWDNGWTFVTKLRVWWHRRADEAKP